MEIRMIEFMIPKASCKDIEEGAYDCPFCYDSIYCEAYRRSVNDIDTYSRKPEWCKITKVTLHEEGDFPCSINPCVKLDASQSELTS
jgi:hypothetical protein